MEACEQVECHSKKSAYFLWTTLYNECKLDQ